MRITLDMPRVTTCEARQCAYNVEATCHAKAITIGHGIHPACDTFLPDGDHHVTSHQRDAGVGACKVSACRHNQDYECGASSIEVGRDGAHADCRTFEAREGVAV